MGAVITWFDKANVYQVLRFDVVTSESRTQTVTVTDHPVEEGADVSDFAKIDNPTASITAVVSQKPLDGASLTRNLGNGNMALDGTSGPQVVPLPKFNASFLQGGLASTLGRAFSSPRTSVQIDALTFPVEVNRLEDVLVVLEKLQQEKQLVECVTRPWSVVNCIITSVTPTRTAETGGGGEIAIEFKSIRKVKIKKSAVPVPSQPKAKKKVELGKQQPPQAPLQKLEKSSFLANLFGK